MGTQLVDIVPLRLAHGIRARKTSHGAIVPQARPATLPNPAAPRAKPNPLRRRLRSVPPLPGKPTADIPDAADDQKTGYPALIRDIRVIRGQSVFFEN